MNDELTLWKPIPISQLKPLTPEEWKKLNQRYRETGQHHRIRLDLEIPKEDRNGKKEVTK